MEMEEIEYLEELEDFILPNGDFAVGSSEGINYQKLNTSQNMTVNTVLATKPPQILKHSKIAVSTVKQQLIPKKQIPRTFMMQTNLNSSCSSFRKQNKIPQKPTNHSKPQILRTKQKPSNISQVMSTERSMEANNSSKTKTLTTQKRTAQKELNNATSNGKEALYDDPLSLDTDDAFLDFDADKNDFFDDFEYDFEVDNFNTGEMPDLDTDLAEFSDKFGEENFRFEADVSYECFDTLNEKQTNKIKKPTKKGEKMEKHHLISTCIYSKHKSDQMNLAKSDGLQHLKEGTNKQKHSSNELKDSTKIVKYIQFTKEKMNSNSKKSETNPQKKKISSKLKTKLLSNESPQLCEVTPNPNDCNELVSHVVTNPTKTCMIPNSNGIVCKKQITNKNIADLKLNAYHGRNSRNEKSLSEETKNKKEGKSQLSNECQNGNNVSDSPELSKTSEYNSDYLKEKVTSESKKIKIKFGSLYLKSIKPPYSNKSIPKSVSQNCSSTVDESTLTSPKTILKENGEIKDTYISMPYEKNKTFFYEPNFFYDFCQTKVPFTYDENKLNNKTNEVKGSTSEDEKKRYSLTPEKKSICEDEEKLNDNLKETCSISNDVVLEKSKNKKESSVISQLDSQSISSTKDTALLEESVSEIQLQENTISDSGILKSADKLKTRSLKIRLSKSTVNKFIRSFKSCMEPPKSSTILQRLDNKSKISFKRKMIPVSNTKSSTSNPSNSFENIFENHISSKTQVKISAKPTKVSTESKVPAKAIMISKQFEVPVKETVISTETEMHANIPVKTLKRTDTLKASLSALSKRKKRKIEENQECTNLLPLNSEHLISKKLPTKSNVESKKEDNEQANNKKSGVGNKTAINSNTQTTINTVNSNHKKLNDSYSASTEINQKDKNLSKSISRKVVKKKNVKKSKNVELCSAPAISSKESELTMKQIDQTLHQEPEVPTCASINYESIVQEAKKKNDLSQTSISTSRLELIQPKSELSFDAYKNLIAQNKSNCVNNEQFKGNHKTYFMTKPHDKNNVVLETLKNTFKTYSTNCRNETEFTVFELPTFIVMKTKIVTRKDLHGDKACIPPIIKDKIDKLPEERQKIPNLKTERLEFKDVCLDINTLLGEDANYLKFASRSERESRMNQVLEDVSLSLEDAQCALKFLQSYLSIHTKDIREKSKNQKFIPIYDSQKKIIGYRKRKINKKKQPELNEKNKPTRLDQKTSICAPTSDSVTNSINFSVVNVRTIPTLPPSENTDITTKNEPLVTDGNEEEMIIPDMSPANNTKSIKNEWETSGQ